jgi:hypothetical protein
MGSMSTGGGRGAWGVTGIVVLLVGGSFASACGATTEENSPTGDAAGVGDVKAQDSARDAAKDGGMPSGVDATMHDAPTTSGDVGLSDAAGDAKVQPGEDTSTEEGGITDGAFDLDGFDVIVIGPPDAEHVPDATPDGPVLDACGICDRSWTCNGFTDRWVSTGPQSCGDDRNGNIVTTLFCENGDTIGFPDPTNNYGTWSTTPTGMTLLFNNLGGGTVEIDCVPGP